MGGDFTVRLEPSSVAFRVRPSERVLSAALRQGIALRYGCRQGRCSSCKYQVLEGEVDFGNASPYSLSEAEREDGWALLCCAYAESDLVVFDPFAGGSDDRPLLVPQPHVATVEGVDQVSPSLWRMRLSVDEGLEFYPGQYVEIAVPGREHQWRSYSIASAPCTQTALEFVVKRIESGAFSGAVNALGRGTELRLRGPYGSSYLRDGSGPVLLVATGSGISPILSILRHAALVGDNRRFSFFYGARTLADVPFLDELQALYQRLPAFNLELALSAAEGECDAAIYRGRVTTLLQERIQDASVFDAYLCGAPDMCDTVALLLAAKGIEEGRTFVDRFYPSATDDVDSEESLTARGVIRN